MSCGWFKQGQPVAYPWFKRSGDCGNFVVPA